MIVCGADCVGVGSLGRCTGTAVDMKTCCNFFDMAGSCVVACPENSTPNTESMCVCNAGFRLAEDTCAGIDECAAAISPCINRGINIVLSVVPAAV